MVDPVVLMSLRSSGSSLLLLLLLLLSCHMFRSLASDELMQAAARMRVMGRDLRMMFIAVVVMSWFVFGFYEASLW